jgi:cholesterol transport system auxiliary component
MSAPRSLPWLIAPLLAACFSGFNSNQLPQQTYVLRLPPAMPTSATTDPGQAPTVARGSGAAGSLQVLLPSAGAGLEGAGIAVLRPGQRLDYYSAARWAAPAPALLQALVIETLRQSGRFALVEADTGPFEAQYLLGLELTHFEADYGASGPPTVRVELVCALGQRTGRQVLQNFTVAGAATASADRMQAVVDAFEQATRAALSELGTRLSPPAPPAATLGP